MTARTDSLLAASISMSRASHYAAIAYGLEMGDCDATNDRRRMIEALDRAATYLGRRLADPAPLAPSRRIQTQVVECCDAPVTVMFGEDAA